ASGAVGDVGVGRSRLRRGREPGDRDRRTRHGGAEQEATSARLALEHTRRFVHEPIRERDALALSRNAHVATFRTAAIVLGSELNARNTSEHPIASRSRNGTPTSGWSASTSGNATSPTTAATAATPANAASITTWTTLGGVSTLPKH